MVWMGVGDLMAGPAQCLSPPSCLDLPTSESSPKPISRRLRLSAR